jgi:NAD(P)-dependent dehydrogenase (short-subunit alcohol dehydrogenase family)
MRGRVALITGGAGKIGSAMAEALAELGADIVLLDVNATALEETANRIADQYGVQVNGLALDLEDELALQTAPSQISELHGKLDVLVNNAAFVGTSAMSGWATSFEKQSVETWKRAMDVNLTSAFALTQGCTDLLRQSGYASVINIASIYGIHGPDLTLYEGTEMGNPAAYAASKGGLLQLTRWLSTVLAPDVRVNAISPGGVQRGQPVEFQERYVKRTPLGRMAVEEDFKGAIAFLASDLSRYVTGQNIVVDGGWGVW